MSVYFIRAGIDGPIKIGFSEDVEQRLVKMQADNHMYLVVLAVIVGAKTDEEAALHKRFQSCRRSGEWFSPSKLLRSYIATLPVYEKPKSRRELAASLLKSKPIKCFTEIIKQWPTTTEMARDLGVLGVTADKWKSRNRIPVDYWDRLIAAARRRRIKGVTRNVMHAIVNEGYK